MIKLLRRIILSGLYLIKTAIYSNIIVHAQCTHIENEGPILEMRHIVLIYSVQ